MARPVLKGGISYNRYVWHTDDGACDECQALDGMEFDYVEDIPDRPHPNCKCWVEVIENGDYEGDGDGAGNGNGTGNPKPKEEPCDCWSLLDEIDEVLGDIESLREEISVHINNISILLEYEMTKAAENFGESILELLEEQDNFLGDLADNFLQSRNEIFENSDKFYHSKAYCEVAQREDEIANIIAEGLGNFRESAQAVMSLFDKEKDFSEIIKELKEDKSANDIGKILGKEFPKENCEDILIHIYPFKKKGK